MVEVDVKGCQRSLNDGASPKCCGAVRGRGGAKAHHDEDCSVSLALMGDGLGTGNMELGYAQLGRHGWSGERHHRLNVGDAAR